MHEAGENRWTRAVERLDNPSSGEVAPVQSENRTQGAEVQEPEEIRRVAQLLTSLPRVAPPAGLKERILLACKSAEPQATISCRTASRLVAAQAYGELDPPAQELALSHLVTCPTCAALANDLRSQSDALATVPAKRPPAYLRTRILQRLAEEEARQRGRNWTAWISAQLQPRRLAWAVPAFVALIVGLLLSSSRTLQRKPDSFTPATPRPPVESAPLVARGLPSYSSKSQQRPATGAPDRGSGDGSFKATPGNAPVILVGPHRVEEGRRVRRPVVASSPSVGPGVVPRTSKASAKAATSPASPAAAQGPAASSGGKADTTLPKEAVSPATGEPSLSREPELSVEEERTVDVDSPASSGLLYGKVFADVTPPSEAKEATSTQPAKKSLVLAQSDRATTDSNSNETAATTPVKSPLDEFRASLKAMKRRAKQEQFRIDNGSSQTLALRLLKTSF